MNRLPAVGTTFTNPGVIHVYAVDGDGRMVLVYEVYQSRKLIGWWVEQAKALQAMYPLTAFHCDPAEPAYIEQFQQANLPAVAATNDIRPGIDAVKERLKVAADGRPRLQLLRGARRETDSVLEFAKKPLGVLDEITAYVWPKGADGKPVKEVPVDDNNHGLDCLRYAVMGKAPWLMF